MTPAQIESTTGGRRTTVRLAMTAAVIALTTAGIVACAPAASTDATSDATSTNAAAGGMTVSGVWDADTLHDIEISYDDAAYEAMIAAYLADGSKEWISATVTIDGTTFENVGLKLKGNSTLRGLSDDADAELSSANPQSLPWIIRLDKYVDDVQLDGSTEFVIRGASSDTGLNEAVALDLLTEAGLAAEPAIAARVSVDGAEALRLVVENPSDEWMLSALGDGLLYKAESGGDWSYRGEDPADYEDVFDQEAGEDDLTPLTDFLQFINESDDATFAADLDEWLDVDAFATYLAYQDAVDNMDDIDGPGNNAYLYYDTANDLMTVVNWDLNLAFGASPAGGGGGMGGGGFPGGDQTGDAGQMQGEFPSGQAGERPTPPDGMTGPDGMTAPDGTALPEEGMTPPDGAAQDDATGGAFGPGGERPGAGDSTGDTGADGEAGAVGGRGGAGFGGQSNVLVERFLAVDEFAAAVEDESARLTTLFYTDGAAEASLDRWTTVLEQAADLVATDVVESDAAALRERFDSLS